MRKGFTLLELIVTLFITSLIFMMIITAYIQYKNINKENISNKKFIELQQKINDIMKRNDRLESAIITPQGILKLKGNSINDIIYNITIDNNGNMPDDYNKYLVINEEDNDIANLQMEYLDISEADAAIGGSNRYLLFVTEKEGISKEGFKFPYKILSLIDIGDVFYRNWKRMMKQGDLVDAKNFLRMVLKPSSHGYIKKITLDNREDTVIQSIIMKITGVNDINTAYDIWDSNKYNIKIANINLYNSVKERVENSISNMEKIVKNIEDWALIQARIAAYNTLNGDNLDKDYFVTCTSDDSCVIDGSVIIDKSRTLIPDTTENVIELEKTTNNGFIVCTSSNDGETCIGEDSYVINNDCIDIYSIEDRDFFKISKALPISRPGMEGSVYNYKFGKAAMESLLLITKKDKNDFGYPIYFTNSNEFIIENLSDFYVTSDIDEYKETLNIPLVYGDSNPPYVAKLFTVFPFYMGGHYIDDGTGNKVLTFNDGWGIYSITIFAHIF